MSESRRLIKLVKAIGCSGPALLSLSLVLLTPGARAADQEVSSAHILILSDEIFGRSVEIERIGAVLPGPAEPGGTEEPGGAPLALSGPNAETDGEFAVGENSRSGMGDGTTPGLGDGMEHSPNEGTANPNEAPR